jgi:hypothetical protein
VPCDPRAVTVCHEAAAPGQAKSVCGGERHSVIRLQSPSSSPGSPAAAQVRAPCARHQPTLIAAARSQTTASPRAVPPNDPPLRPRPGQPGPQRRIRGGSVPGIAGRADVMDHSAATPWTVCRAAAWAVDEFPSAWRTAGRTGSCAPRRLRWADARAGCSGVEGIFGVGLFRGRAATWRDGRRDGRPELASSRGSVGAGLFVLGR